MDESHRRQLDRAQNLAKLHKPLAIAGGLLIAAGVAGMFLALGEATVVPIATLGVVLLVIAAFYYKIKGVIKVGGAEIPIGDVVEGIKVGEDQLTHQQVVRVDEVET
jgi:hypothetical protein